MLAGGGAVSAIAGVRIGVPPTLAIPLADCRSRCADSRVGAGRVAPLSELDARDMLASIRGKAVLEGVRGKAPSDRAALERTLRLVAQLADDFPAIDEMDINPLLALPRGVLALDARVRLRRAGAD